MIEKMSVITLLACAREWLMWDLVWNSHSLTTTNHPIIQTNVSMNASEWYPCGMVKTAELDEWDCKMVAHWYPSVRAACGWCGVLDCTGKRLNSGVSICIPVREFRFQLQEKRIKVSTANNLSIVASTYAFTKTTFIWTGFYDRNWGNCSRWMDGRQKTAFESPMPLYNKIVHNQTLDQRSCR